jgi:hypothetical protein
MTSRILSFPGLALSAAALSTLAGVASAQEQTPSNAELERRLETLAAELESLRMDGGARQAPDASYSGMGPAASRVYGEGGQVSIGGYGEIVAGFSSDREDTTDALRVITYFGYRFDEDWVFNSEIEFEHGNEVAVEFAYIDGPLAGDVRMRAGHLLVPMGIVNEMHEPTTFYSVDRPITERYVLPSTWHENGIGAYGSHSGFAWRAYLMNGFDMDPAANPAEDFTLANDGLRAGRQKGSKASAESLAVVARVDWEGTPGLLVGAAAYSGDSSQDAGGPDFATTIWDLHAEWQSGPWRVRGLYADANVDEAAQLGNPAASEDLGGWYLEAGYDLFAGGPSALIPFVRREEVDLQDGVAGGAIDATTVGMAWQPRPEIMFKLEWQRRDSDSDGREDVLGLAVAWIF